jgi:hypothetical protein
MDLINIILCKNFSTPANQLYNDRIFRITFKALNETEFLVLTPLHLALGFLMMHKL